MRIPKRRSDSAQAAADFILRGEVVIIPTDTIYGFSAKGAEGDARIRAIKGRGETKPFIELIARVEDFAAISAAPLPEKLARLWPGPLTVIVPRRAELGGGTVALRCPGDEWLRSVVALVGGTIYSTSANRSGCPPLWKISEIEAEFAGDVGLIVDDGDKPDTQPSTLVDISGGELRVLRGNCGNLLI